MSAIRTPLPVDRRHGDLLGARRCTDCGAPVMTQRAGDRYRNLAPTTCRQCANKREYRRAFGQPQGGSDERGDR